MDAWLPLLEWSAGMHKDCRRLRQFECEEKRPYELLCLRNSHYRHCGYDVALNTNLPVQAQPIATTGTVVIMLHSLLK